MKKIYLLLLPVLFLWGSCSMDDVLESNGELNLTCLLYTSDAADD